MTVGDLIVEYRNTHNLSQRQFANKCGLSNGYISMIEKGENPKTKEPLTPTLPVLKKIAIGLGISLDTLLSQADDIPISTFIGQNKELAPEYGDELSDRDLRLLKWFRSLPEEKQKAILISQDAPEDLL